VSGWRLKDPVRLYIVAISGRAHRQMQPTIDSAGWTSKPRCQHFPLLQSHHGIQNSLQLRCAMYIKSSSGHCEKSLSISRPELVLLRTHRLVAALSTRRRQVHLSSPPDPTRQNRRVDDSHEVLTSRGDTHSPHNHFPYCPPQQVTLHPHGCQDSSLPRSALRRPFHIRLISLDGLCTPRLSPAFLKHL
jgi:hypothetical protein